MTTEEPDGRTVVRVEEDIEDLIPVFLRKRREDIRRVAALSTAGEWREVQRIGHKLKGTAGAYGFIGLSEIGATLEEAARSELPETVAAALTALEDHVASLTVLDSRGRPIHAAS